MWKTAFKNVEGLWYGQSKPYSFKVFKGCLLQVSLGPVLNTLSKIVFSLLINRWLVSRKQIFKQTIFFYRELLEKHGS